MATFTADEADTVVIPLGYKSGTMGSYLTYPGFIAFTGPGADTLVNILSNDIDPQLKELTTSSTNNTLVLTSKRAGRAVIRIEASQFSLRKDTTN